MGGIAQSHPGRPNKRCFDPSSIISGFETEEILSKDPDVIHDFVSPCYDNKADREILEKWMEAFKEKGIPFVVTETVCDENSKRRRKFFSIWTPIYA